MSTPKNVSFSTWEFICSYVGDCHVEDGAYGDASSSLSSAFLCRWIMSLSVLVLASVLLRKSFIFGLVVMSAALLCHGLAPVHFKAINKRQEAATNIFSIICIHIHIKIAKNMLNLVCVCPCVTVRVCVWVCILYPTQLFLLSKLDWMNDWLTGV